MSAVEDLELPEPGEPPTEPEPPKPARERTAVENQAAKADAIALALWRRGLTLAQVAHLPYSVRGKAPSLTRFARQAFREAADITRYRQRWGTPPEQPPHSRDSPTWRMVRDRLTAMHAYAAAHPDDPGVPAMDLTGDAATGTLETPCPPTPGLSGAPSAAATTSTTTTSTAGASTPTTPPSPGGGTSSATAGGDPVHDPEWRARRYARTLGTCRSCQALVRWVSGPDGVTALHRDPDQAGRWVVDEDTLHARPAHDGDRSGPRWVDHASTCPARPRARGEHRAAALADGHARCESCHNLLPDPESLAPGRDGLSGFTTCPSCDGPAAPPLPGKRWVLEDGRRARHHGRPARHAPNSTYRR